MQTFNYLSFTPEFYKHLLNIQKKNKKNCSWLWPVGFKMFWLLKYFDNFKNFTSHSMSMLSSTRKLGSKGSTLSKSNLDMMKNSSHRDEYPAMQSNGPLPQVKKKGDPHCSKWPRCLCAWHCHYLWQSQHNFYHCCTLPTQHKSLNKIYILSHIYQIDWTQLQQVY